MRGFNSTAYCKGRTQKGKLCNNFTRSSFEIFPGKLYIPLTCALHAGQETEIREKIKRKEKP